MMTAWLEMDSAHLTKSRNLSKTLIEFPLSGGCVYVRISATNEYIS